MKRFKKIYIETTNICNLECDFCPKTKRRPAKMSVGEFERVLQQIKPYTDYVYFHLMGEPFMNPGLEEFLQLCEAYGMQVNITTNGTLIQEVQTILLGAAALRQVNFSISSYEANEGKGGLEGYLDPIAAFISKAEDGGRIISSIRLWNLDSLELKGRNELNARILHRMEEKLSLEFSLEEELKTKRQMKLRDRIYINMAEKFDWPDMEKNELGQQIFCHGLRDQIGILVDGTVVPCCLDSEGEMALGNVFSQELKEILSSERALRIYDGFSKRQAVEELCKRCAYAKRY